VRIRKNTVLGSWEMAESDRAPWQSIHRRPGLVQRNVNYILLADDMESVRSVYRRTVSRESPDFVINEASNGQEALDLFVEQHHGIIIMDLVMPVMSGQDSFDQIKKHCAENKWELPSVIFCTGHDPSNSIRQAVADDPIHCMLQKPVSARTLIDAIRARI
jgi:CheY-like chemotaxis protein